MASRPIEVRRVYDDPKGSTGEYRVLVDRLWPRGLAKSALRMDLWAKDIAPSSELRRWYGHQPDRFDEFSDHYLTELRQRPAADAAGAVLDASGRKPLVLLTATRDIEHSGAVVLARHLRRKRRR